MKNVNIIFPIEPKECKDFSLLFKIIIKKKCSIDKYKSKNYIINLTI